MKSFTYTIQDALGIHARPAGMLVKEAGKWKSTITIDNGIRKADARRVIAIMGMAVKTGQTVTVTAEGEDEAEACASMEEFFKANL